MLFDNEDSIIEKRRRAQLENRTAPVTPPPEKTAPVGSDVPPGESILEARRLSILQGRAQQTRQDELNPPPASPVLESRTRRILPGRRTRPFPEEELYPPSPRRSKGHRLLWSLAAVVVVAAIAIFAYGYWAVQAYHGRMNVLPALQSQLVADGHRIDAAGQAMQDQKATLGQRLANAGSIVAGRLQPPPTRAELEQRTAALQGQINTLESAQQSANQQLRELQGQVEEMKSQQQPALPTIQTAPPAAQAPPPAAHPPAPAVPDRIEFQANLHQPQQISPDVRFDLSRIDATHQHYDAAVRLNGGRTLWVHSRPVQQPVKFYKAGNATPNELVVTQITKNSVSGYLQLSEPAAAAAAAESH